MDSKNTTKWPKILFELGYEVQLIEQAIKLQSAQKIVPDVVAVSRKLLHVIVTDCKSGNNIDNEQDARYQELASDDLKYYVTVHDTNQLKHTVCYVDNHTNHTQLEPHTKLPFMTFSDDAIQGRRDFGMKQLNEKLCNFISLEGMREPTGYYPFSPQDEDFVIAPHVLRGLISYLMMKGHKIQPQIKDPATALEILKLIHPYNLVSTRHKDDLIKRIGTMINMFRSNNREFNEQVSKIEKGEYKTSTLQSLAKICEALIVEYESQTHITDRF